MEQTIGRYLTAFAALVGEKGKKDAMNLRHLQVLAILCENENPVRVNELAATMKVDRSWCTRVIDLLVEKRIVERRDDPADRRFMIVTPTRIGRNLHKRNQETFEAVLADAG